MSRKRKPKHKKPEAVPHNVDPLAEGTGPVVEVVDADAQALADAAAVAFAGAGTSGAEGELTDDELSDAQPSSALDEVAPPAERQPDGLETVQAAGDVAGTAPPFGGAAGRGHAPAVDGTAPPFGGAAGRGHVPAVEPEGAGPDTMGLEGNGEPGSELDLAPEGEAAVEVVDPDAIEGETGDAAATLPTSAATMAPAELKHLVEALVFASDKPVTLQRLRQLTRVSDVRRLEQALVDLGEDFRDRGMSLQSVSGGYQFRTHTKYSGWVQQLIAGRPVRLSRAQLETLSIIAYRQPITRPEIDEIRGVDSSGTLRVLIERSLIRILGKREEVGRPMLYGTTKEFLDFFSLTDLRELPTLREYSELTAESRRVMSDRLGVELEGEAPEGEVPEVLDHDPSDAPMPAATDEAIAAATSETTSDLGGDTLDEALAGTSGEVRADAAEDVDDPMGEAGGPSIVALASDSQDAETGDPDTEESAGSGESTPSPDEPIEPVLDAVELAPATTDEALAQSFDDDVDAVIATQTQDLDDETVGESPTDEAIETAAADTVLAEHAPSSTAPADDTSDSVIDPVE